MLNLLDTLPTTKHRSIYVCLYSILYMQQLLVCYLGVEITIQDLPNYQ